jgi:hypothetical protein
LSQAKKMQQSVLVEHGCASLLQQMPMPVSES